MKRLFIVVGLIALVAASVPTTAAAVKPRMPVSAADWARFSGLQREAALDYVWDELQSQLAAGTAKVTTVGEPNFVPGQDSGLAAPAVSVSYNCPIQWIDLIEGSWIRGGGWTDTSSNVYYIAASRLGKKGQLLRDGVLQKNWYHETYNASHAENWSGYVWKWWYEHFNWTNKGWHGARLTSGGSWLLGPDRYCSNIAYH
jgi:hypothetical protein